MHRPFRAMLLQASILAAPILGAPLLAAQLLAPAPARAADVTPEQAAALQAQVTSALGGLLGIQIDGPIKITAAGDHFDLVAPTFYRSIDGTKPIDATAQARQAPDGTWTVDHLMVQTPLRMTINVPIPASPNTTPPTPATVAPMNYTIDLKGQDGRITWDPSFTRPSTFTSNVDSVTVHTEGGPITQDSTIGAIKSLTTLKPSGPDRVDVQLDGTVQSYRIESNTPTGPMLIVLPNATVKSSLNGVSREKAVTVLRTLASIGLGAMNLPPAQGRPPGQPQGQPQGQSQNAAKLSPETVRILLAAMQDFASDFSLDETIDGMTVNTQGQNVAIDKFGIGFSAKSASGLLDVGMDLGVQGLALPDLPLGDMAALIPTRVALHPGVSGLGVAELTRIATAASEKRDPAPEDINALFSHGGIVGTIDSMTVEVAGAVFTGQARMTATAPSPAALAGTAHVEAANLDTLIQKMSTMPAMAQALPVLALAKGLGKVVDNRVVWDLVYKDGKVLVNNVDLSAMSGAQSSAPTPPPPAAVAPPPVPRPAPGGVRRSPTPDQIPSWAR